MATPKPGPTTAPMLTMPSDPAPDVLMNDPLATPPEPDDIADPTTPPEALPPMAAETGTAAMPPGATPPCTFNDHEAMLQGFCMALQDRLYKHLYEQHSGAMKIVDATYAAVTERLLKLAETNEHATYQLSETLLKMSEPTVLHNPYKASVETISPQGFPVLLEVAKRDAGELVQAIQGLTAWLAEAGYAAPEGVRP